MLILHINEKSQKIKIYATEVWVTYENEWSVQLIDIFNTRKLTELLGKRKAILNPFNIKEFVFSVVSLSI